MKIAKTGRVVALLACVSIITSFACGDDFTDNAKKVCEANKDSVLFIHAVANVQVAAPGMPEQSREHEVDIAGTVIDKSGLMICSLSSLDPAYGYDGREVQGATGMVKLAATSVIANLTVRLADKTEVPARIVLKDAALDLAFIQIDMKNAAMKGKTLTVASLKSSAKAERLDSIVSIGRLPKLLKYAAMVNVTRVVAVITDPSTVYLIPRIGPGMPAFLPNGQLLGICLRKLDADAQSGGILMVLPAADIQKIVKQAKIEAAKPVVEPKKPAVKPVIEPEEEVEFKTN